MNHKAGKALSKWTASFGDTIMGGQPLTFDDITTEPEPLQRFTDALFEDDTAKHWSPRVRELLVVNLLLRYDQFCDVLLAHPLQQQLVEVEGYDGLVNVDSSLPRPHPRDPTDQHHSVNRFESLALRDNPFLCRVNQALSKAEADEWFPSWITEARKSFIARNLPALPIQTFQLYGATPDEGITMDPRCFTDHFNVLASITQSIHMEQQRHRHILNDLQSAFNRESHTTSTSILGKILNMERMLQRLESNLLGEAPKPTVPLPRKGVVKFTVSSKCLGRGATLVDVATAFFVDDYETGYEKDKESSDWKDLLSSKEKSSIRKKFSKLKRSVKILLFYAESYPTSPHDDPDPTRSYKEIVRRIATEAYKRLQAILKEDNGGILVPIGEKKITPDTLQSLMAMPENKNIEKNGKLPDNTPEDAQRFFGSD